MRKLGIGCLLFLFISVFFRLTFSLKDLWSQKICSSNSLLFTIYFDYYVLHWLTRLKESPFSKGVVYFHTPLVCAWAAEFWQAVSSYRNSLWTLFLDWLLNILVVVGGETSFAIFSSSLLPIWGGNVTLSVGYAHGSSSNQSGLNVNVRDVLKKLPFYLSLFSPSSWVSLILYPFSTLHLYPLLSCFHLLYLYFFHPFIPYCFPPSVFVQRPFHKVSFSVIYCPCFPFLYLPFSHISFHFVSSPPSPFVTYCSPSVLCLLGTSLFEWAARNMSVIC